jgi:hypothetical protein
MSDATAPAAENQSHDPLKMVADAMEAAVQAAKDGAADAKATAAEAVPAAAKMLSNLVYNACYGISYGVVFPSVLVARSIPRDNPVVHGFVDGARAAIDMVNEMKPPQAAAVSHSHSGSESAHLSPPILGPDGQPIPHGTA